MAYLPCQQGPHRHTGKNTNVYLAILSNGVGDRTSFRLCPEHWRLLENDLTEFELDSENLTPSSLRASSKCVADLQPVNEFGRQFFVTAYPAKNERKDYWGKLHDQCRLPWVFDPPLSWVATA